MQKIFLNYKGMKGVPNSLAYVGSKFGATRLTRATAAEFGPENIRVNSIQVRL